MNPTPRDSSRVYRAPGRINLIGEHTDYNDGWVMPASLQLSASVTATQRTDRLLRVTSTQFPDLLELDLNQPGDNPRPGRWSNAIRGIALLIERHGYSLPGLDLHIRSDIPMGAGLSSSAAVEVACAFAMLSEAGRSIDLTDLALLCQRANHEFSGVFCGIMDQFIACHGRADTALMIDTRDLSFRPYPLPPSLALIVANTMVKHNHASGEYNRRRAECEEGVKRLRLALPSIRALRDVSLNDLEKLGAKLPAAIRRRCRHVVSENGRVAEAAAALERGDFARLGQAITASHASLRDDYEVSSRELDTMVELAQNLEGVYGARMMGGGFGGCALVLAQPEWAATIQSDLKRDYHEATGLRPDIMLCRTGPGVELHVSASASSI